MSAIKGKVVGYDVHLNYLRIRVNYYKDDVIYETGKVGNYDNFLLAPEEIKGKTALEIKAHISTLVSNRCDEILRLEYAKTKTDPQVLINIAIAQSAVTVLNSIKSEVESMEISKSKATIEVIDAGQIKHVVIGI